MDTRTQTEIHRAEEADSPAAWLRLAAAVLIGTIGGVGMWSVVVALPAVQAEFGVARADAALPYTLSMLGYALGGVLMGKLSDRYGIVRPMVLGILINLWASFSSGSIGTNVRLRCAANRRFPCSRREPRRQRSWRSAAPPSPELR